MISGKKDLCAVALDLVGTRRLLWGTRWRGLLVFNYHRVGTSGNAPWDRALWSANEDTFAMQVRFLKRHFDIVGPRDLSSLLRDRKSRGVMITFDDGYRDNFEVAFPILQREGGTATFFITTGFLDQRPITWWDELAWMVHTSPRTTIPIGHWTNQPLPLPEDREPAIVKLLGIYKQLPDDQGAGFLDWLGDATETGRCPSLLARRTWMTWDMVRELRRGGMSIGGHTVTHPVLANCSPNRQRDEVVTSKQRTEEELGEPIEAFSYPVGQSFCFDEVTKRIVQDAGYRWAFSFMSGFARPGRFDAYAIPRMAVSPALRQPLFRCTAVMPQLFAR